MVGETRVHKNQINKYGPRQRWAPQLKNSLFIFLMFLSSLNSSYLSRLPHVSTAYSPSFLVCTGSSLAAGNGLYVARSSRSLPIFSAASSSPTGVPRDWVSVSSR